MKKFNQLKKWSYHKLSLITPGKTAITGAARALLIGSAILFLAFSVVAIKAMSDWTFIFFLLGFVLLVVLATYLSAWVLKKINLIPRRYLLALAIASPLLIIALSNEVFYLLWAIVVLSATGAAIAIFSKGKFKKLSKPKKVVTLLGVVVSLSLIVLAVIGFAPKGFELDPIINAASLNKENVELIDASSPSAKGTYKVQTLTYGSGKDKHRPEFAENVTIKTDSVNGVAFLDNWEGPSGWYREKYWGFDAKALPVNGYVWYPEGEGPFPLALIVHGNHSMQDFSDTGYAYLGELMASRGFIFVSVDENFFNSSWSDIFGGLDEENDARGWMLLEHLKTWLKWNKDPQSPFYNKVDPTKLALLGHSRGGEAVGHAALLNKMPYYYDDASIPMDYNFDIKSIVAIAPVDGQYEPGNSKTELKDINYFVLHGSQDGDVTSFSGSKQYERITFSDSTNFFKSGLYIRGANHGQFNTSWGDNDVGIAGTRFLNNAQLLSKEDQEEIAKVYISAFLETTLNDNRTYQPLFKDARKGQKWLPETIYLNQYEDASFKPIATFDTDFDVQTTDIDSVTIQSKNLSVWREQEIALKWEQKGSRAAYIGWHYDLEEDAEIPDSLKASYTIVFDNAFAKASSRDSRLKGERSGKADSTDSKFVEEHTNKINSKAILTFSLSESTEDTNPKASGKWVNTNDEETANDDTNETKGDDEKTEKAENKTEEDNDEKKAEEPIDFTIHLVDQSGNELRFPLSTFSALQREIGVRVWKVQFILDETLSENVFQTFFFPLDKLKNSNPKFNVNEIQKIELIFDKTKEGVIVLDNVGFTYSIVK